MNNINLTAHPWRDYELIDSGDNRKLERYGSYIVIRPETQAIWKPARPKDWKRANAEFSWIEGKGVWQKKNIPQSWELSWEDIRFIARLTSFKHTGVFPEQVVNWQWLRERVDALKQPKVLNLFGYTGIASIAAAKGKAQVTHVDASKQSNAWAKENARLSGISAGISEGSIRYILEDALKFSEREARRGASYDGIILDPPAFGRGPKGEVWKIEESIPRLLTAIKSILSSKPGSFFLLNGYAAGYSPQSFLQAVESFFSEKKGDKKGEYGELRIQEAGSERCVPAGIYVRFTRTS
ncbi:MAG: class I SAM-dependent methyltransferase [Patescibacteria group bacterium]